MFTKADRRLAVYEIAVIVAALAQPFLTPRELVRRTSAQRSRPIES